ncbi:hypothetical protein ACFL9T_07630 [Thermodesulfobacteriota bacterium]
MRSRIRWIQLMTLTIVCLFGFTASAEEVDQKAGEKEEDYRNRIAFFGGNTQDGSENGLSGGLSYEFFLGSHFGVGGAVEYAGGDFDSWVIIAPLFLHPYAGWGFWVAPGVEIEDGETNFLFRIGLGYEFELWPRWSLGPEFNADFSDGETKLVYGLTLSLKF